MSFATSWAETKSNKLLDIPAGGAELQPKSLAGNGMGWRERAREESERGERERLKREQEDEKRKPTWERANQHPHDLKA